MGVPVVSGQREFSSLAARTQVRLLRAVAARALGHWPLAVERIRLVYHGYNTTFRVVDAQGRSFALRLSVNHRKPQSAVLAEMSWLAALSRDTELSLPSPVATVDGSLTATAFVPGLPEPIAAALFTWLPGTALDRIAAPEHVVQLGRAMAVLHRHAAGWKLPEGASLPYIGDVWATDRPFLDVEHPLLDPGRRALFEEAVPVVRAAHAVVDASGRAVPLHADLHLANAKWHRGLLSVLDFDDAVTGVPAHDLAISSYYLRPRQPLVDALFEGYMSEAELPQLAPAHLEALLSARNLLLVDEVLRTNSADFVAMLPRFLENSAIKQRHFLDTGQWRHDLPGVVLLW
jgi:Ser/Thr protein kinase RdoA (MazF antagonist)